MTNIPPPFPDYAKELAVLRAHNRRQAALEADAPWMQEKFRKHLERQDMDASDKALEALTARVKADDLLCSFFCKDPQRQNFHQNVFSEWIKKQQDSLFIEPTLLPSAGPNSLVVVEGMVKKRDDMTSLTGKSIDFRWDSEHPSHPHKISVYAAHKYIGEDGGSQDNQFQDVCDFVRKTALNTYSKAIFVAVCDGPYFQRRKKTDGIYISRLDWVRNFANQRNVIVCTSQQLRAHLNTKHQQMFGATPI